MFKIRTLIFYWVDCPLPSHPSASVGELRTIHSHIYHRVTSGVKAHSCATLRAMFEDINFPKELRPMRLWIARVSRPMRSKRGSKVWPNASGFYYSSCHLRLTAFSFLGGIELQQWMNDLESSFPGRKQFGSWMLWRSFLLSRPPPATLGFDSVSHSRPSQCLDFIFIRTDIVLLFEDKVYFFHRGRSLHSNK